MAKVPEFEIKQGHKVKRTDEKYPSVGVVTDIEGKDALVEFRSRSYGSAVRTEKRIPLDKLARVCKETVYRDYGSNLCGRYVKNEETGLCGLHEGHRLRRIREDEARKETMRLRQEEADRKAALQKDATEKIDKIFDGTPTREKIRIIYNTDQISMQVDDFLDLLRNA